MSELVTNTDIDGFLARIQELEAENVELRKRVHALTQKVQWMLGHDRDEWPTDATT